jgi:dephospho-CoA kinase
MPHKGIDDYKLSSEKNSKYFKEKIMPMLKDDFDFSTRKQPTAYFTAGLPGAGKSKVLDGWQKENSNIIVIDADELRKLHPHNSEVVDRYGADSSEITHPDAVKWVKQFKEEAIDNRANYILDSSMRNPKSAEIEIGQAIENGYDVKVTMVAVNQYESLQGVFDRYANQYEHNSKEARFVNPSLITEASTSIKESATTIDNLNTKDFKIVDRGMNVIYDKSHTKGTAKENYENFTNIKNWEPKKVEQLQENWNKIIVKLEKIDAPEKVVESAKTITKDLSSHIKEISQKKELGEKMKAFLNNRPEKSLDKTKDRGLER